MTDEQLNYIKENGLRMSDREILNNLKEIYGYKLGVHSIYKARMKLGIHKPMTKYLLFTDEMKGFIAENYLTMTNEQLYQELVNRGYKGQRTLIREYRYKNGLRKAKEGCFVKEGYARKIYIDNFGEIPEGYRVKHKDGNLRNLEPNNLMLTTERIENRRYKEFGKNTNDAEINLLMMRTAQLQCATYDKRKGNDKRKRSNRSN